MKMKEVDRRKIPGYGKKKRTGYGVLTSTIRDFLESGMDAVELTDLQTDARTVYNSLFVQNQRMGSPAIVSMREKRLYLLRKEDED